MAKWIAMVQDSCDEGAHAAVEGLSLHSMNEWSIVVVHR